MSEMDYFGFFSKFLSLFLMGTMMTIRLLVFSFFLSFCFGTLFGVLTSERLKVRILSPIVDGFTFVLRAVPFFVQLLIVYFVLPDLIGYNFEPFFASVIALGLCSSGYMAQIVRGGINSISVSQWEGAFALGLNRMQSFVHVIFPQTFKTLLPMINNELDSLLKSTAIASSIGLLELTRVGMNIVSREMKPVPIYLTVALFYVCMSASLNLITRFIERKFAYVKN